MVKKIYKRNIETDTKKNKDFRRVVTTTHDLQVVLMHLKPFEDIGEEVHPHTTQFNRVEKGTGVARIDNKVYKLKDGDAIVVPPGSRHNIIAGDKGLWLYVIYGPPEHRPNEVEHLKH